jgi:hypothetical protein
MDLMTISDHRWMPMISESHKLITQRSVVQIHPPQPTVSITYIESSKSRGNGFSFPCSVPFVQLVNRCS